ncbi:ABC transporter permease [Granulicella sibirica]|uniref:ABC efflux pump, inner membrane subunit n=1 Tax=Granulicella sibirica TaxID=2479048 RepID=A0A4Q0T4K2_9BACT|nr:ABC transporter permease [Granulicella sibirica]RXH56929.1 ABC efflux pump, inner membrane subunit [Granulicella sibirica]
MNQIMRDVRYSLRQLAKAPGFTITAVLTLALGIGANAAIFTLVHAVLLRQLPVTDPSRLVRVGDRDDCCVNGGFPDENKYSLFAYDMYVHLRDHTPEFEQLAAMQSGIGDGSVTARRSSGEGSSAAIASRGEYVSGNYFLTFGLAPAAGRLMIPSDDAPAAPLVAVMGYNTWQRDYNLDPSIVGSTFVINAHPFTIVGVAPQGFFGDRLADATDYFLPFSAEPVLAPSSILHNHPANWVYLLGRTKEGTQLGPLQEKMSGEIRDWLNANVEMYKKTEYGKQQLGKTHTVLTPGGTGIANMAQEFSSGLHLLTGIAALVLLIACANIANLVLVRGLARRSETSIRMALGASRSTLIRQTLTESIVLALIGGAAGIGVAYAGVHALLTLAFSNDKNLPIHAAPSIPVLAFAFGISLLTGIIFGLAPAWITSHGEPAEALRGSGRSTKDGSSLVQRSLVILQAALSLVLLVGAGLLTRSLNRLEHQNFGIDTQHRVVIHLSPENAGYKLEQLHGLYADLEQKFHALPGVENVGLSLYTPLEGNNWGEGINIAGRPEPGPNENSGASWNRANPEYFEAIGQKLVRGRSFTDQDTETSRGVAVVNQAFVKKFFPKGEDPIGQHFGSDGPKSTMDNEIVGVMSDVVYNNPKEPIRAMYMRPLLQRGASGAAKPDYEIRTVYIGAIVLQFKGSDAGFESRVRQTLSSINPNLTLVHYESFGEQVGNQFSQERMIARLTLLFGLLALVLAAVGLYGVTSYTVARRTPEIGIRMALGAARGSVVAMVLRDALLQAGIGLAIGIPVALVCVRFVKAQLYQATGTDYTVLAGATLALALAATVAGLVPARRAASTDPVKALRSE